MHPQEALWRVQCCAEVACAVFAEVCVGCACKSFSLFSCGANPANSWPDASVPQYVKKYFCGSVVGSTQGRDPCSMRSIRIHRMCLFLSYSWLSTSGSDPGNGGSNPPRNCASFFLLLVNGCLCIFYFFCLTFRDKG